MSTQGPYPRLSWSHSRSRALHRCARLYYHTTYGSWRGNEVEPTHPAWLTYRLARLIGPAQWVGITVHDLAREVVATLLRRRPLDYVGLIARADVRLELLRTQTLQSSLQNPEQDMLLAQWRGDLGWVAEQWRDMQEAVQNCITNLLDCAVLDELRACAPRDVLASDRPLSILLPLGGGDSITIWAAPDLAYRTPGSPGEITIVDWKTGGFEGAEMQAATYALVLRHRWRLPPGTAYRVRIIDLGSGREHEISVTDAEVSQILERIREDVTKMQAYQADRSTNEPVEMGLFPQVPEGSRECRWCPFAELCGRGSAGREGPSVSASAALAESCSVCARAAELADLGSGLLLCTPCWLAECERRGIAVLP